MLHIPHWDGWHDWNDCDTKQKWEIMVTVCKILGVNEVCYGQCENREFQKDLYKVIKA